LQNYTYQERKKTKMSEFFSFPESEGKQSRAEQGRCNLVIADREIERERPREQVQERAS
jgi:hypothetical protein